MMLALFPDLERQLEEKATQLAQPQRRWVTLSRPAVLSLAVVGLTASGAAALGIWQPTLGRPGDERVAVAGTPPAPLLNTIGALRRPQTDEDRASASEFALTFPTTQSGVRTDFVRRLGTVDGAAVVLIPTTDRSGPVGDDSDQLCLWVADPGSRDSGNRQCTTAADAAAGKLFVVIGHTLPADLEAARAAYVRRFMRDHAGEGGVTMTFPPELREHSESFTLVGAAPDNATTATVSDGVTAEIANNWYSVRVTQAPKSVVLSDR